MIYLANISETVQAMTTIGMTHIYKVVYTVIKLYIYNRSVYIHM